MNGFALVGRIAQVAPDFKVNLVNMSVLGPDVADHTHTFRNHLFDDGVA